MRRTIISATALLLTFMSLGHALGTQVGGQGKANVAVGVQRPMCVAVRFSPTRTPSGSQAEVYGWAMNTSLNTAVAEAKQHAMRAGAWDNERQPRGNIADQLDQHYLHTSCGLLHGAIVANPRSDSSGVIYGLYIMFDKNIDAAKSSAIDQCNRDQHKEGNSCEISRAW